MRKWRSRKGILIVKLDIKKAYDRLNWDFILDTLCNIGLPDFLVSFMMKCVMSSSMRVMSNGEMTDKFLPANGIR